MRPDSLAVQKIRKGKPLTIAGPGGKAVIARAVEGFTATVEGKAGKALRRFSEPSAALHWAYPQVNAGGFPSWLR